MECISCGKGGGGLRQGGPLSRERYYSWCKLLVTDGRTGVVSGGGGHLEAPPWRLPQQILNALKSCVAEDTHNRRRET